MKLAWNGAVWVLAALDYAAATPFGQSEPSASKRNIVQSLPVGKRWFNHHIVHNDTYARLGRRAPEAIHEAAERAAAILAHNEKVKRGLKMNIQTVPGFEDTEYLVPVTVGTSKMNVEIDTGSVHSWFFSTLQPAEERGRHAVYNPGSKAPLREWTAVYHSEDDERGWTNGVPYAEKVVLGSATATAAHIVAATAVAPRLQTARSDGSVGMGFDYAYCDGYCNSFIETANFNSGSYQQKFGLDIKASGQSTWEFGSYDDKTYPFAKQSWTDVVMSTWQIPWYNQEGQWLLEGGKCFINKKADKNTRCGNELIVSTSTPLILMPTQIVQYYYSKVPGAAKNQDDYTWYFPCSSTLPSFGFDFDPINHKEGSHTPGKYLNLGPLNDNTGRCFGGLQEILYGDPSVGVLGTAFLKSQYVGFEAYKDNRKPIGGAVWFAPKVV